MQLNSARDLPTPTGISGVEGRGYHYRKFFFPLFNQCQNSFFLCRFYVPIEIAVDHTVTVVLTAILIGPFQPNLDAPTLLAVIVRPRT